MAAVRGALEQEAPFGPLDGNEVDQFAVGRTGQLAAADAVEELLRGERGDLRQLQGSAGAEAGAGGPLGGDPGVQAIFAAGLFHGSAPVVVGKGCRKITVII